MDQVDQTDDGNAACSTRTVVESLTEKSDANDIFEVSTVLSPQGELDKVE